jgi:hypothetical protein
MSKQPVLFYSNRDGNSKQIIDTLKALNKQDLCRMIEIESVQRSQLPAFLKSVPTLYLPDTNDIYVGKDIFAYIAKPVAARREVPTNAPGAPSSSGPSATTATGDLESWSFSTAGGFSDAYSSWDGKASTTDQLFYTFLGNEPVAPGPVEPTTKQSYDGAKDGRNEDVASRLKRIQQARDNEFKGVTRQ